ncbi:probable RNA polymerase II nuclear localization protein SLC7A6OS [Zeugodacus cucurbitae]|uniref:probable RNA polymerase II nuclear localization protein SLC7A6OS n=1 Tax=Zeugodacus cucurbitae TaxID=28588 RepID=UPI0023D8E7B6|nr:probable RNA polymerase II nuclear localization protein SLC7A6OS [Zeugodacus cucurbitae]
MPAVVRIKRRIDEEPLSAFILNSKKRRRLADNEAGDVAEEVAGTAAAVGTDVNRAVNDKDGEVSTILKFAGTIQEQDDGATTQLARLTKEAAKELVLQKSVRPPSNHTERARQEMRQALHESRFRVVNCMRTTLEDANAAEAAKEVTIVDIEKQDAGAQTNNVPSAQADGQPHLSQHAAQQQRQTIDGDAQHMPAHDHANNAQQATDSDTGYVYDLYLPENELQVEYADMMDDNYLSIRPYDDLVYEDRFNDDDEDEDSEDSNNENYYTNDYPDEDDDNEDYKDSYDHGDIDAMALGMRHMRMGIQQGYIHTFDDEDSSVSGCEDSSDDVYYDDEDHIFGRSNRRKHGGDDDGDDDDDDDVDYYDAGGNSDDSDA